MVRAVDISGQVFGELTALNFNGTRRTKSGTSIRQYSCRCSCGEGIIVDVNALTSGNTKSCGCTTLALKHGMHDTRFYRIWIDMKTRCLKEDSKSYESYGRRGITCADNWSDFENFKEDMFATYDDSLTLDRIDPNGNYCKENCQWVSKSAQSRNKTMMSSNKTGVTGVREWVDKKTQVLYFVADTQFNMQRKSKHFSTAKYGYENAFKLACEWREKSVKEFNENGAGFSEYHGLEKLHV